jgi:hypothetical protein
MDVYVCRNVSPVPTVPFPAPCNNDHALKVDAMPDH